MADVLEVLDAIYEFKNFDKDKIEGLKEKKKKERGGFDGRIVLEEVEE